MKKYFLVTLLAVFALFANANNPLQHGTRDGNYYFDWNPNQYAENLHVILTIKLDGTIQENENLEIGFFYNNQCRGREILSGEYYSITGYYVAEVTVNGTNGMGIGDFRLYDHSTNQELNVLCDHAAISFVANQDIGDYFTPEEFAFTTVPDPINITTVANPTEGGVTTGGGNYEAGASCTITATANEGYTFNNWTLSGSEVTTNASYTFTVSADATYTANFSILSYTITTTADPAAGGVVSGGGTYEYNSEQYLSATANTGYIFVNWTLNNEVVSTYATFPITVTGDAEYVAHFVPESYNITVTANPTVGGTVEGAGEYDYNSTCTLTATPSTGYHFVNWTLSGTEVSTEAEYSFTVTGAGDYVANFAINNYSITATANPTAGGTVSGTGNYDHFSSCTLTATPATGYHFVNWTLSGTEVSTETSYSFTVTGAGDYVANFEINSYTISASTNLTGAGTITGAGTYDHFSTCTLTVTPNYGYTFVNWTLNGNPVGTNTTLEFTVTGEASYVANFTLNSYTISATVNPTESGTVAGTGDYDYNTTCTLTATPATGYHFMNWTLSGTEVGTETTLSFTVTADASYVANFAINNYTITATANPTAGGTVSGAGNFDHGTAVTLTATSNSGYSFVNWTKNGTVVSTDSIYNFTATENAAFVANFGANNYDITVTANPAEGGTVTGAGNYDQGATVTLTATPNVGYSFINWTKNGTVVSTEATYSFTANEPAAFVANFSFNNYTITATANPAAGGTITGAGNYDHGTAVTLTATANEGYSFMNWTKNDSIVTTETTYSFTATENASFVANFMQDTCVIAVVADPIEGGTVTGAGTYNVGATVTLTATANENYAFVNWTLNGVEVGTQATYSFTASVDAEYVAHFVSTVATVNAIADPANAGTITGAGVYDLGAICTLTATAGVVYNFVNWTLNGQVVSTEPSISFTVNANVTYVAHFTLKTFVINVTASPAQGGEVTGAGTYEYGTLCSITATPNEGYAFVHWTKNGTVVSEEPEYTFYVLQNGTYKAVFALQSYEIAASVNPANGGTIIGAGTYNYGETCTLSVALNDNYVFSRWMEGDQIVSEDPTYSFTVTENRNLVAYVEYVDSVEEYNIAVSVYPNPVSDKLTIETSLPGCQLEVYSITGAKVYSQNDCAEKVEINVSTLPSGAYVIRMVKGNSVQTATFMKE